MKYKNKQTFQDFQNQYSSLAIISNRLHVHIFCSYLLYTNNKFQNVTLYTQCSKTRFIFMITDDVMTRLTFNDKNRKNKLFCLNGTFNDFVNIPSREPFYCCNQFISFARLGTTLNDNKMVDM